MHWRLHHATTYRFSEITNLGPHEIRLCPRFSSAGELSRYSLRVWPQPSVAYWRED